MQQNILNEMVSRTKAAKLLGVSPGALRYWEKQGTFVPERTVGGHRRYSLQSVKEFSERKKELANLSLNELEASVKIA